MYATNPNDKERRPASSGRLIPLARSRTPAAETGGGAGGGQTRAGRIEHRSQAARGEPSPRRYVGRASTAVPAADRRGAAAPAVRNPAAVAQPVTGARWSARLVLAVGLVTLLCLGLRVTGITSAPVDPPLGVEATHAAFAQVLAGRVPGMSDVVSYFPPSTPWYGAAPVDPASGLPLFGWLTALLMSASGAGDWVGRALAILFSAVAGVTLFGMVRRLAGARAGLYALLFYSIAPLSVVVGQRVSPGTLSLAAQALAIWAVVQWRASVNQAKPQGNVFAFWFSLALGAFAALVDPGSVFLAIPAAYLFLSPRGADEQPGGTLSWLATKAGSAFQDWRQTWRTSPYRGKVVGFSAILVGSVAVWQIAMSGAARGLVLGTADSAGVAQTAGALLQGGTYVLLIGEIMERLLTIFAAPLLVAGLMKGARGRWQMVFHWWAIAAVIHVLVDAGRIGRHEDVLLPLILPICALVGIGSAWAGSLPARIWLAVTEQRRESDSEYAVSPHTSWLLDLPEERVVSEERQRPQAQQALGRSVARRTERDGARARRGWFMAAGNAAMLGGFALMSLTGWKTLESRLQPSAAAIEVAGIGQEVAAATHPGSRLIVVGGHAPEVFYGSGRTGWALSQDEFGIARVQELQRAGAAYLLSTDQDWLGKQSDYTGLLTSYSVARLGRDYILFDLNTRPAASDRLYFLQSGHTLGGEFRRFWEKHGDVRKLGYPLSEEIEQANPLDGQVRRVQYFERAVLEYHREFAGTANAVMLAAVGRWVTTAKPSATVVPFKSTPNRAYFPQTGHSVKESFLKYWQRQGGVTAFGYPITEELPEINLGDGKVYTVQYFERARFEWHPTFAGTPDEVQLGLIGKQAWELRK